MNETIILTFEEATNVTTNIYMLIALGLCWFIAFFIYIIIGAVARGKSSSGQIMSKPMMFYSNYWYGIAIFILQLALLVLYAYPIWLKFLN